MDPPDGSLGDNFQEIGEGAHVLLIDKISMIGCTSTGRTQFMCKYDMKKNRLKISAKWDKFYVRR